MMRNFIPNSDTSISSPTQLLTGTKPDLSSLATVPWGTPVISWVPFPADELSPRAEYGIVVGYHLHAKQAIRFYTLNSADKPIVVVRSKYKIIDEIPDSWLIVANRKSRIPISIFPKKHSTTINKSVQLNVTTDIIGETLHGGTITGNDNIYSADFIDVYHDTEND